MPIIHGCRCEAPMQMNMYLNYYKENESNENDKPSVGIILSSGKDEAW